MIHKTQILLVSLVLICAVSAGLSDVTKIPATKAIYIDMENLQVHNNTSILKCDVQMGAKPISATIIQFNISALNISNGDIGILALKVADVSKQPNATNMIVLMPMGSNWDENSSYLSFFANMEPILDLVTKKDMSQMEVSTNDGQVFDVSKNLKQAKLNGDRVSFLLMAFSDNNYSVEYRSVKSDEGPCLVAMPYPVKEKLSANITNSSSLVLPASASVQVNKSAILIKHT